MRERATASLSTVIVDDEPLASDELAWLLKDFADVEVIGTGRNGLEAVDLIEKLEPDLAFLDVQMPGLDGLGVIRKLRERQAFLPQFVLSTAYDQYAVEAFRLDALDYLLKPVDRARLAETVERARRHFQELASDESGVSNQESAKTSSVQRTKLMVRNGNRNHIVDARDLVYATIDSGVITLVTSTVEGQSSYKTLEELQANLDPGLFWRAHRSFVVNINKIREVVPWFNSSFQVKVDDKKGTEIPVSRVQTRRLRELLKL